MAVYARLKPGMTRAQALAATRMVAARIDAALPEPFKYANNISVKPIGGFARFTEVPEIGAIAAFFAALLAIAGMVLLIACVNVAGLLLARASARKQEIAVRLSLGAGRGRLLQQLLVESLLLCVLGAGSGMILARTITWAIEKVRLPLPIPIHVRIDLDWRVALYGIILTIAATLACGLLPAWQATRESIAPDLRRDRKMRLRRALVCGQMALSLVVLAIGLLFMRNLFRASEISPGFDLRHTIRAQVNLPAAGYKDAHRVQLMPTRACAN